MTLKELFQKYKEMPPAKRRLLLITTATAMIVLGLMTAPPGITPARVGTPSVSDATSDCRTTKMRASIFGRSLATYDWQSGNCLDAIASGRKVNP